MSALCIAVLALAMALAVPERSDTADELIVLDAGEGLRATVAPAHGGELAGLEIELHGTRQELLYRARDYSETEGWRGKAPFLWPAVGTSLDPIGGGRGFRVGGRFYPMPGHGFARDHAWRLLEQGVDTSGPFAVLGLSSNNETRKQYPFDFELSVEYRLVGKGLRIRYDVQAGAGNQRAMPFTIGNHVTFKAPLLGIGEASDLRFHNDFPDYLVRAADRTFAGEVVPSPYRGERALSALPQRRSVALGGRTGTAELTIRDPSGLSVLLRHEASFEPAEPVIRFNLWADTEEGFFSPEPWLGTQNALNTGAGLLRLEPGERWHWTIEIIPGRAAAPTPLPLEKPR